MEIVSKIPEPKLVWNIFSYVAESPLTKEKKVYIEYMRNIWSENGEYHPFPKFMKFYIAAEAEDFEDAMEEIEYYDRRPLSIQLKLFENQDYDWTQRSSERIDEWLFDKWDDENNFNFECYIELAAERSVYAGVKLQLDYDIIPPQYWGYVEAEYTKVYNWFLERGV